MNSLGNRGVGRSWHLRVPFAFGESLRSATGETRSQPDRDLLAAPMKHARPTIPFTAERTSRSLHLQRQRSFHGVPPRPSLTRPQAGALFTRSRSRLPLAHGAVRQALPSAGATLARAPPCGSRVPPRHAHALRHERARARGHRRPLLAAVARRVLLLNAPCEGPTPSRPRPSSEWLLAAARRWPTRAVQQTRRTERRGETPLQPVPRSMRRLQQFNQPGTANA